MNFDFISMCIGGGIGCFVAAPVGFILATVLKSGAQADRKAELAKYQRDNVSELGQMFDKEGSH